MTHYIKSVYSIKTICDKFAHEVMRTDDDCVSNIENITCNDCILKLESIVLKLKNKG